jgi:hypothetical protein
VGKPIVAKHFLRPENNVLFWTGSSSKLRWLVVCMSFAIIVSFTNHRGARNISLWIHFNASLILRKIYLPAKCRLSRNGRNLSIRNYPAKEGSIFLVLQPCRFSSAKRQRSSLLSRLSVLSRIFATFSEERLHSRAFVPKMKLLYAISFWVHC